MPTTNINLTIGPYVESVTGTAVDNTDPVNPIINIPSNGITGIAPVGNLLRVLTIDGSGNVVTVEASHISEDATSTYLDIDSPSAYLSLGVQDSGTGDVAYFQAQPTFARMAQRGGTFEIVDQEAYLDTVSVPTATAGVIGIGTDGKLFTTSQGLVSVVGGTDISIDNTDPI